MRGQGGFGTCYRLQQQKQQQQMELKLLPMNRRGRARRALSSSLRRLVMRAR